MRTDYEQLIKFQMGTVNIAPRQVSNSTNVKTHQPMDVEDSISHSETVSMTVIDVNAKNEIIRLKNQRELFLNTKVYNENDAIVKMIDEKILSLGRQRC